MSVVAIQGRIYVTDTSTASIVVFDVPRRRLFRFGQRPPYALRKSVGLALDSDLNVYVADVKRGPGVNSGNCTRPRGSGVDDVGNIYVTDASFNNFQIFNAKGEMLLAVGQSALTSSPEKYGLLSGITIDETGRIYVIDQLFNKVEVFRRLSEKEGQRMLLR